jgi:hypothetical protein
MFTEPHGQRSACFANVASATFTENAIDALCRLLRISFRSGFHDRFPKSVFCSEDGPNVSIPNPFKLFRNTLHIWNIYRAQRLFLFLRTNTALGIDDRVNETLGITVQLKIVSLCINRDICLFYIPLNLLIYTI